MLAVAPVVLKKCLSPARWCLRRTRGRRKAKTSCGGKRSDQSSSTIRISRNWGKNLALYRVQQSDDRNPETFSQTWWDFGENFRITTSTWILARKDPRNQFSGSWTFCSFYSLGFLASHLSRVKFRPFTLPLSVLNWFAIKDERKGFRAQGIFGKRSGEIDWALWRRSSQWIFGTAARLFVQCFFRFSLFQLPTLHHSNWFHFLPLNSALVGWFM